MQTLPTIDDLLTSLNDNEREKVADAICEAFTAKQGDDGTVDILTGILKNFEFIPYGHSDIAYSIYFGRLGEFSNPPSGEGAAHDVAMITDRIRCHLKTLEGFLNEADARKEKDTHYGHAADLALLEAALEESLLGMGNRKGTKH